MKTIKFVLQLTIIVVFVRTGVSAQSNALNFDGTDDFIEVAGIADPTGNFTVEAWARMETFGMRTVFSKIQGGYYGFTISYDAPNNRMGADIGTGTSWPNVLSLAPWNLNQWYHVAMVYNATVDSMHFYQDGVLQGSVFVVLANASTTFKIGNDDWFELWDGDIDEVRVWSIARTQTEIQNTMNTTLTGTEQGLANYYKFDQGTPGGNNTSITNLIDNQGANNGTFMGFTLNGSSSNFVGSLPLGIINLNDENISIYPNPVRDEFILENNIDTENMIFEILNSTGQIVVSGSLIGKTIVRTEEFESGIYLIKLKSGQTFSHRKIIVN